MPVTTQTPYKKELDIINTLFIFGTPLVALILMVLWLKTDGPSWPIFALAFAFYLATGLSITAGYHRLLAHKAYKTNPVVKFLLLAFGAGAFQNSALKWCSDHRVHHTHEDGELDPYNIKKGLFYAHVGWIIWREEHLVLKKFARDLELDPLVAFQHRYYWQLGVLFGIILPTLMGYFLGSWLGGLALAGFTRLVVVHHATFCINSFCHKFGHTTYNEELTAKDNWLLALVTYGEGHHNFHHAFPNDYRNGIRWFDYDPTKWLIAGLKVMGLAEELKTTALAKIKKKIPKLAVSTAS